MTRFKDITVVACLAALGGGSRALAIVSMPSEAGVRYLQCVERLSDNDTDFRRELLRAITQDRASGTRFASPWTLASRQKLLRVCGPAPARPFEGEVSAFRDDVRPPEVIAMALASGWSGRIKHSRANGAIWVSKQEARAATTGKAR